MKFTSVRESTSQHLTHIITWHTVHVHALKTTPRNKPAHEDITRTTAQLLVTAAVDPRHLGREDVQPIAAQQTKSRTRGPRSEARTITGVCTARKACARRGIARHQPALKVHQSECSRGRPLTSYWRFKGGDRSLVHDCD